jgi:hypothetical protein
MRKVTVLSSFMLLVIFVFSGNIESSAQGKGKSNGNSNGPKKEAGPPPWAPAHGYRAKTRYVYFKDYNVYYDNTRGIYISISGGKWVVSTKIPSSISGIDLVAAVKIDLDFDGDDPQKNNSDHQKKYPASKRK